MHLKICCLQNVCHFSRPPLVDIVYITIEVIKAGHGQRQSVSWLSNSQYRACHASQIWWHEDEIHWEPFPHYWPCVWWIHHAGGFTMHRASNVELDVLLWCVSKHSVYQWQSVCWSVIYSTDHCQVLARASPAGIGHNLLKLSARFMHQ